MQTWGDLKSLCYGCTSLDHHYYWLEDVFFEIGNALGFLEEVYLTYLKNIYIGIARILVELKL